MAATNIVNDALNDSPLKPKLGMEFDSEQDAYDIYNAYGGKWGLVLEDILVARIRILVK